MEATRGQRGPPRTANSLPHLPFQPGDHLLKGRELLRLVGARRGGQRLMDGRGASGGCTDPVERPALSHRGVDLLQVSQEFARVVPLVDDTPVGELDPRTPSGKDAHVCNDHVLTFRVLCIIMGPVAMRQPGRGVASRLFPELYKLSEEGVMRPKRRMGS